MSISPYRIRAYVRAQQLARKTKERKLEAMLHLMRVRAEIRIGDEFGKVPTILPARLLLNDFHPDGVRVFIDRKLPEGTEVSLVVEQPEYFYIRATVRACNEVPRSGRVLSSQTRYTYRIELDFEFAGNAEQASVVQYCGRMGTHLYTLE